MQKSLSVSIIIPTLGRPESLQACLDSIKKGSIQPDEIILIEEEGELAALRNKGASKAKGDILIFIDDDVEVSEGWLEAHLHHFLKLPRCVGSSGPAIVRSAYRSQRDLFRWPLIKRTYDYLFLEGKENLPGHIARSGTWTTGACREDCAYEGPVDYLEACNMAFKRDIFEKIGGFDSYGYRGIGDWSEPDASFRAARYGTLWFSHRAKLFHNCAKTGAYNKRARTGARLKNYLLFSKRWIKPYWRHTLFKWFLRTYYTIKDMGWLK